MTQDTEILPIGYSTKIRKKRPGPFLVILVIISLALSIYFLITEYSNYKDFTSLLGEEKIEKEIIDKNEAPIIQTIRKNDEWGVTEGEEVDKKEQKEKSEHKPVKVKAEVNSADTKDTNKENLALAGDNKNVENSKTDITKEVEQIPEKEKLEEIEDLSEKKDVSSEVKKKYHIIISSVDSKEAANKQQEKFKNMSVNTSVIHVPKENRYRISLGAYVNMKEATIASESFRSKYPDYKTWIWKVL